MTRVRDGQKRFLIGGRYNKNGLFGAINRKKSGSTAYNKQ